MKRLALLCGFVMWAASPLGAGQQPLTMKVTPAVAFAPANLIVRAMIEADADNRGVEIVAESTEFYRSSEITLDGERAPRTNTFEFRSLPPGAYLVRATLLGAGGHRRASVNSEVNIISGAGR